MLLAVSAQGQQAGDPFSGLTPVDQAAFEEGKEAFEEEEDVLDGLGPIFNGTSCAQCYANPTVGGDSNTVETRFGTTDKNKFDALEDLGGSLIQSQGIGTVMCKDGTSYTLPLWGLRFRRRFLHDGRATTPSAAIAAHDGAAKAAAQAFQQLPAADQRALLQFLDSL